jgi:hypothetical protein
MVDEAKFGNQGDETMKNSRENFKPYDHFAERSKPEEKHRGELVDRTCLGLGCGAKFTAHRFGFRMCDNCRSKAYD